MRCQGQYHLSRQLRIEVSKRLSKSEEDRRVQASATRQAREQAAPWKSISLVNDLTLKIADPIRKDFFRFVNLLQVYDTESESEGEPAPAANSSSRRRRSRSISRSPPERASSSTSRFAP